MCVEFCNNTVIGYSNITRDSFNQYDQAMNYMQNHRSNKDLEKAAQYKLTSYLSEALKICPKVMLEMAFESLRKVKEANVE